MITTNHGEKSSHQAACELTSKYYSKQPMGNPYARSSVGYETDGWYAIFKAIADAAQKTSGKLYY